MMNNATTIYIQEDDMDLIQKHFELMDKLHHADESCVEEVAQRICGARRYIRKNCRRIRSNAQRFSARTQRMIAGAALALLWAGVLVVLLG